MSNRPPSGAQPGGNPVDLDAIERAHANLVANLRGGKATAALLHMAAYVPVLLAEVRRLRGLVTHLEANQALWVERAEAAEAEVARLRLPENRGIGDAEIVRALKELDRLRAALEEIASVEMPYGSIAWGLEAIANAALAGDDR